MRTPRARRAAWLACLVLTAVAAAETVDRTDGLCAETLRRGGVELRLEPIQGGSPTRSARDAQHIPGFEIRGFAGEVRQEVVSCPLLALRLQALDAEGDRPERLRLMLTNRSDDLVTVTKLDPAIGSGGLPWAGGLTLPLELDLEATALLLEAAPAAFPPVTPVELAVTTEDGYRQVWRLESRSVEEPEELKPGSEPESELESEPEPAPTPEPSSP